MEKITLLRFFALLSSKIESCLLPKNKVAILGLQMPNLPYFSFQSQNSALKKRLSYDGLSRSYFSLGKLLMFLLVSFFGISTVAAQTLPPATSCTSKDLELVEATLPGVGVCGNCTTGTPTTRTLYLSINNKTGSLRTAFAFWGTLKIYNVDGTLKSSTSISGCNGTIQPSSLNTLPFYIDQFSSQQGKISYLCGESLELTDLFLAWTTSNKKENCDFLKANSATINPKCGTLPSIQIFTGLDASAIVTNATCTAGGSILVTPFGGKSPYSVQIGADIRTGITGSTNFSNLPAGPYTIDLKDANNCTASKSRTVGTALAVTANAGNNFTKTCISNASGKQIGVDPEDGFSYSWSPATGLDDATVSNPIANPSVTTTYMVTKSNTSTGCSANASVTVAVDIAVPTAGAGSDVTINCTTPSTTLLATGGVSYSWSPAVGLSATNIANPTATPSVTTTYTVTVTGANGCTATDDVKVTVDKTAPVAAAGSDVTINCSTPNTVLLATGGVSYSWSPATGLSATNIANPTATPSITTTYIVTVKGANGCTATDDVKVTVDKSTPAAAAGNDVTINCSTTSTTLLATGGVSYSWLPAAGLSATNIANPTATPSVTTTYTVTVTGANGCTATDDVKVTVDKTAPVAAAGSDVTINCSTPNTVLLATGGVSYSWSPATGLSATNIANPTATPSITTTYTVTVTGANGCTAADDVKVTVDKSTPAAAAGNDVTINCSTTSTTLLATGGVSYSWSPAAGLSATNIANPTATPSVTTTYTVNVTGANGCTATDDVKVTVATAKPDAPTFCIVQPSLCSKAKGSVTINTPCGADYEYSIKNGDDGTWQSAILFDNLNPGDVTGLRVRNVNTGCFSDAASCSASNCSVLPCPSLESKIANQETKRTSAIAPLENTTETTSKTVTSGFKANSDPSCYSFGYWKNQTDGWCPTYSTTMFFGDVFVNAPANLANLTLLQAINTGGGGIFNLARQGVAALLNTCSDEVDYPAPYGSNSQMVIDAVNAAYLIGGNAPGKLATQLDILNNSICTSATTSKTAYSGFDAYPVPFKDQLTIKYNFDYKSDVKIEVFNAQGISILSKTDTNGYLNKEITLDLHANKGKEQVYVVKLTTDRGTSTKKVLSSK